MTGVGRKFRSDVSVICILTDHQRRAGIAGAMCLNSNEERIMTQRSRPICLSPLSYFSFLFFLFLARVGGGGGGGRGVAVVVLEGERVVCRCCPSINPITNQVT